MYNVYYISIKLFKKTTKLTQMMGQSQLLVLSWKFIHYRDQLASLTSKDAQISRKTFDSHWQ